MKLQPLLVDCEYVKLIIGFSLSITIFRQDPILSILRFLIWIAEFTGTVDNWNGVLAAADSQSVLRTLGGGDKQFLALDEPVRINGNKVVLDVLCPDGDILIEIQGPLKY